MLFSILLPSKNGHNYIENSILSVIDQDFRDYELIIGNNNNNLKFNKIVSKYLKSNSNIKVVNHNKSIPVHRNWQSCLDISSGEYIIMLGDDDCLLKDALSKIYTTIKKYNFPEAISFNGISYHEIGSYYNSKYAYYKKNFFNYKKNKIKEGFINKDKRIEIVKKMFNFENKLPLNMQTHILSKKIINKIKKPIYQPPFPDHYALNASLLLSKDWVISYKKIVAVGISNKSFGHYFYSDQKNKGIEYLGLDFKFDKNISGSILNTCQMIWLKKIKTDYNSYLKNTNLNFNEYFTRQLYYNFRCFLHGQISMQELIIFLKNLDFKYKILIPFVIINPINFYRFFKSRLIKKEKLLRILQNDSNIYNFTRTLKSIK